MALRTIYLTGVPGQTYVQDGQLAYAEVMLLLRSGKMVVEVDADPEGREFVHEQPIGKLQLDETLPILEVGGVPEDFIAMIKE